MRGVLSFLLILAICCSAYFTAPVGGVHRQASAGEGIVSGLDRDLGRWRLPSVAERQAAYQTFLSRPFVTALPWVHSVAEANAKATERGCQVFAYFTRSHEACVEAKVFEEGVFLTDWFRRRSRDFVLYLNVESRLDRAPGAEARRVFAVATLPHVILFDPPDRQAWRVAFTPTDEAALDAAVELMGVSSDAFRVLARDPRNEAAQSTLKLVRALTGAEGIDLGVLDTASKVKGVDARVLRRYRRERARFVEVDKRSQVDRVLQTYGRDSWHPTDVKPVRDGEIHALYQRGVLIPVDAEPTLEYCDAIIGGAMDRGDRATAERYLPAARVAAARAVANYRRETERNRIVNWFATRMVRYFENKLALIEKRMAR